MMRGVASKSLKNLEATPLFGKFSYLRMQDIYEFGRISRAIDGDWRRRREGRRLPDFEIIRAARGRLAGAHCRHHGGDRNAGRDGGGIYRDFPARRRGGRAARSGNVPRRCVETGKHRSGRAGFRRVFHRRRSTARHESDGRHRASPDADKLFLEHLLVVVPTKNSSQPKTRRRTKRGNANAKNAWCFTLPASSARRVLCRLTDKLPPLFLLRFFLIFQRKSFYVT